MGPEYLHIDPEAPDAFEKELEKRKAFISEMVARYQPEYLELPRGPTGWRALLQMLPDIRRWLDEVSPATKIVMLTGPVYDYQVEEFNAYVDNPYVDIAAVHLVELDISLLSGAAGGDGPLRPLAGQEFMEHRHLALGRRLGLSRSRAHPGGLRAFHLRDDDRVAPPGRIPKSVGKARSPLAGTPGCGLAAGRGLLRPEAGVRVGEPLPRAIFR